VRLPRDRERGASPEPDRSARRRPRPLASDRARAVAAAPVRAPRPRTRAPRAPRVPPRAAELFLTTPPPPRECRYRPQVVQPAQPDGEARPVHGGGGQADPRRARHLRQQVGGHLARDSGQVRPPTPSAPRTFSAHVSSPRAPRIFQPVSVPRERSREVSPRRPRRLVIDELKTPGARIPVGLDSFAAYFVLFFFAPSHPTRTWRETRSRRRQLTSRRRENLRFFGGIFYFSPTSSGEYTASRRVDPFPPGRSGSPTPTSSPSSHQDG